MKQTVMLTVLALVGPAFALTDVRWAVDASGLPVSGGLTDDSSWTGGVAPVPGENIGKIDRQGGSFTVTLPDATSSFPFWVRLPACDQGVMTLDGRGSAFLMTPRDSAVQAAQPFRINDSQTGEHLFNLQGLAADSGDVLRFDNLLLVGWATTEPSASTIDVRQGLMDFNTGVVWSWVQLGRGKAGEEFLYRIGPGATNRFKQVDLDLAATRANRFLIDGGCLEATVLAFNGDNSVSKEFTVTNGGTATVGSMLLGNVVNGSLWRLDVSEGSLLAVTGAFKQCAYPGHFDVTVGRDSTLAVATADPTWFGNAEGATLNVNLRDGGTLRVTGDFDFTKGNARPQEGGAFLNAETGTLHIARGAVFRMAQHLLGARDLTIRNEGSLYLGHSRQEGYPTTWDLSSATFDFSDEAVWYVGYNGSSPTHLVITNGTNTIRGKEFVLAQGGSDDSTLTVGGAADVTFGPFSGNFLFNHVAGTSTGAAVNLTGGRTTWKQAPVLGSMSGSQARMTVNVSGGTHVFETAQMLGGYSLCDWIQTGGEVNFLGNLTVGHWAGFATPRIPQVCRLSEGVISAECVILADGGNRAVFLECNGGVLRADRLYGWNGASVRKPESGGLAALRADGGRIEAKTPQSAFMIFLDEARVGREGLTLHAEQEVSLCAPWADLDGAEGAGRLVLSGAGTKRLYGRLKDSLTQQLCANGALTNGVTVCAGGTVLLAEDVPVDTRLVVTNNAVVSFEGSSREIALKGLTLGDAVSGGTLRLDPGSRLHVSGPLALSSHAVLDFTSSPEPADYDFLTVDRSVEIDEATRTAWARMFIAAGRQQGRSYTFSVSEDASGNHVFRLQVAVAEPLSETTTWQGEGTDWETSENWSAGTPGPRTQAAFSSAAAPAEVTLGMSVTIGALAFANGRTVLTGGGTIGFTDSGCAEVSVTAGSHVLGVGLAPSFELPFDIAEGTDLRLAGAIVGGSICKTGEGALTLAGEGSVFRGAVRVNGGLLSAASVAALGAAVGGAGEVRLEKGVFAVSNAVAGAAPPQKLTLAAGEMQPAVVRTDADVVLTDFSHVSGNLVKRGVGRLTLAAGAGTVTLARDSGYGKRNFASDPITYRENGSVPDDLTGFHGLNVIEGELELKGTAARAEDTVFDLRYRDWRIAQNTKVAADPVFTLDHATVDSRDAHCYLGCGLNVNGGTKTAQMNLRNGAWFRGNTLQAGRNAAGMAGSAEADVYTHIHVSGGSTLETDYLLNFNYAHKGWSEHLVEGGSAVLAHRGEGVCTYYPFRAVWDTGSVLAATRDKGVYTPTRIETRNGCIGEMTFRGGSTLYLDVFKNKANLPFSFTFDGGAWDACGDMDFCFWRAAKLTIATTGAGLVLPPAEGQTYRMAAKITGTGGVIKTGAGTLAFVPRETLDAETGTVAEPMDDPVTWGFEGTLDVRQGTVTVANGCTPDGALPVKVASDAELRLASASDVTLRIDLGYSDAFPMPERLLGQTIRLPIVFDGERPAKLAKWRVEPVGLERAKAVLSVEGDAVCVTVCRFGLCILVR